MITPDNRVILSKGYAIKTGFAKEYETYVRERYAEAARPTSSGLPCRRRSRL
jgi:hypothetical protein